MYNSRHLSKLYRWFNMQQDVWTLNWVLSVVPFKTNYCNQAVRRKFNEHKLWQTQWRHPAVSSQCRRQPSACNWARRVANHKIARRDAGACSSSTSQRLERVWRHHALTSRRQVHAACGKTAVAQAEVSEVVDEAMQTLREWGKVLKADDTSTIT